MKRSRKIIQHLWHVCIYGMARVIKGNDLWSDSIKKYKRLMLLNKSLIYSGRNKTFSAGETPVVAASGGANPGIGAVKSRKGCNLFPSRGSFIISRGILTSRRSPEKWRDFTGKLLEKEERKMAFPYLSWTTTINFQLLPLIFIVYLRNRS